MKLEGLNNLGLTDVQVARANIIIVDGKVVKNRWGAAGHGVTPEDIGLLILNKPQPKEDNE